MYTLFAAPGWGSAIAEALLDLGGLPYRIEAVDPVKPGPARDRPQAGNPLGQIPTPLLPDTKVSTESAAIALHIADHAPGPPSSRRRARRPATPFCAGSSSSS